MGKNGSEEDLRERLQKAQAATVALQDNITDLRDAFALLRKEVNVLRTHVNVHRGLNQ